MTYEEKKAWLSRYREAKKEGQRLREELEKARESAQHTTQSISPVPGGNGDGQSLARSVELIDELEQQLLAHKDREGQLYTEILDEIADIPDDMVWVILHKRYLECLTWPQIASLTHLALRWVYTLHHRAVERLPL